MTGPSRLDRLTEAASRASARLGGAVILLSALLVTAEVFVRNAQVGPLAGVRLHAFELTNWGFAAAVAFGFSYALTQRAHIRIDLLYGWAPLPVRATLDAAALLSLAAMACFMAWHGWGVAAQSLKLGAMPNSTLRIPMAIPQAVWAGGLTWFAGIATLLAGQATWRLLTGRFAALHAAAGVTAEAARPEAGRPDRKDSA